MTSHYSLLYQHTIREPVEFEGFIPPYTKRPTSMKIRPGPTDMGIVFRYKADVVHASYLNARREKNRPWVILEENGVAIEYPEHLLSALSGLGIDNAIIELEDPFVPTMPSGGVREIVEGLECVVMPQKETRKYWTFTGDTPKIIENNGCILTLSKTKGFEIAYQACFEHKTIDIPRFEYRHTPDNYRSQIMDARSIIFQEAYPEIDLTPFSPTFLLVGDKEQKRFLNRPEHGPRYNGDEFVRHKILDLVGDLSLIKHPFLNTRIYARKTGHEFHISTIKKILESEEVELVDATMLLR